MVGLIQNNTVEIIIGYLIVAGLFVAYHMHKAPELDDDFKEIKKNKDSKK